MERMAKLIRDIAGIKDKKKVTICEKKCTKEKQKR